MSTPLRDRNPETIHLVTSRTLNAQLLLRPGADINNMIGSVLARYQEEFKIELFAYVILSNHSHLLLRAPLGNFDEFMENVNREISRRANRLLGRQGKFWHKRYRAQAVLNDKDLEQAFVYVVTNPVKHGAAPHPAEWAGLSSYRQNLSEKPEHFVFMNYSARDPERLKTTHNLTISPLPSLKGLDKEGRRDLLSRLLEERTAELAAERISQGAGFMTAESVRKIDPFSFPQQSRRSPTGECYSKDPETIKKFRREMRDRRRCYDSASVRYRLGDRSVEFPLYTFKPPLHRRPRIRPFTDMPDDHFRAAA